MKAGKIGSCLVMLNGILMALLWQYVLGPRMRTSAWLEGECSSRGGGGFEHACLGQQGVFRVSLALVAFYGLCALGCRLSKMWHNALWSLKMVLLLVPLMIAVVFIPARIVEGYVWVARVGAAIFVILQMVVIVDLAYAVNDWFVAQSNAAGYSSYGDDEGLFASCGSLDDALSNLLYISLFLFAVALTGIVLLFVYFSACPVTTAFIAMTLVLCVGATATQLVFSDNGNLLTSASVSAYAVYVAYVAISRIPNDRCNPLHHDRDILGIVVGLVLALVSLAWTTHSTSAAVADLLEGGDLSTPGDMTRELVPRASKDDDDDDDDEESGSSSIIPPAPIECLDGGDIENTRFNLALALVAMYVACSLTNWGTWPEAEANASEPLAGKVNSWLNIAAQWVMFLIYFWTLLAPMLFPDRDFSS
ncbi:hypothetical protein CTAYLR_005144 [Chrysophaeum taylorii]|uniref:Serine incorporator n=1 Tax=Chrysophaeum taylorii TaxID=2483200 RepID=A0AAD7UG65_9STRA|nr:hypothetical protein CTAYLR_005144 [Chrysophaeum taylorii]